MMKPLKATPKAQKTSSDRRSGLNRRWINSPYEGPERRSGKDRRTGMSAKNDRLPEKLESNQKIDVENLLISNTIQLEALFRLLLEKGMISEQDILEAMKKVQSEYRNQESG